MKHKSSLISRFAASTAVLAALIVVLAVVFFVVLHADFFEGAIQTTLRGYSLSLAEAIWKQPERDFCRRVAKRHAIGLVVVTPSDRFAFTGGGESIDPDEQLQVGPRYRRIAASGPGGHRITFFWDMVEFAYAHVPLLIILIVMLLLMIGVTYVFQLAHLRPLRWLRTGVDAVSQGDFKTRVPVVRHDEIGQVAQAFNQMTRRVEQMMNDRERLLGDVSHELRSPLARIKVALELLEESDKREAIKKDVREMESLTTVLLERQHIRARMDHLEPEPVDFCSVVRRVVETFEGREPGVVFADPGEPMELRTNGELARVLVQNLVENAVKFSLPDSRRVEVSLRVAGERIELLVVDDGRGIPESESERVFRPFVKLDPARAHRTGYGLGLDLCRRIVDAHGGTIEMSGHGERGTRALVSFPKG